MTRYVVYDTKRYQYLARFNGTEPVWTDDKMKARVWRFTDPAHQALNRVKLAEPHNDSLIVTER